MPRQNLTAEFKNFIKGIITEVTPLTFPDNASLDEVNFVLNRDGSRQRRLGLKLEEGGDSSFTAPTFTSGAFNAYLWKDGKGLGEGDILCIHTGERVFFLDVNDREEGYTLLRTVVLEPKVLISDNSSFVKIDKYLVFARGDEDLRYFTYSETGSILDKTFRLEVRDFFGVDDYDTDGTDLSSGIGLLRRPTTKTDAHIYNLRNQSWGHKYTSKETGDYADPIASWKSLYTEYPASSDVTTRAVYADTGDSSDRTLERFWEENLHDTDYGTSEPPLGSFIIDFVDRSSSRLEKIQGLETEKSLSYPVTDLPSEYETGSANTLAAYSGRVFYAGFPGGYSENSKSPNTESMILFSQLIKTADQFGKCYQTGDPTSLVNYDLISTDGGYLQVEDAYNIQKLVTVSSGLLVVAANGVWLVAGGSDYSFSADNYIVKRISDKGSVSGGSIVKVDDTVLYWSDEGIFQVASNQYGDLTSTNISKQTIQTLYEEISYEAKERCYGIYDQYELKVRWVYGFTEYTQEKSYELILDTTLGAFCKNEYITYEGQGVFSPVPVPPYLVETYEEEVTASGETVTDENGENVYTEEFVKSTGYKGVAYLTVKRNPSAPTLGSVYTVATLSNPDFRDWVEVDGVGVDAPAYLLTGYYNGGDAMRQKQVAKLITYLNKSETGFEIDSETGDWNPVNPSSCLITTMWNWTDNAIAGKWSSPVQGYRHKRQYFPSSIEDNFDNGETVIVTTNKIRGRGRVLSFKVETEEGKDLQLLGWAMVVNVNGAG